MTKQFKFNNKSIVSLRTPLKGKRDYYYDRDIDGLCLAVTDTGYKSFLVYRKINGKPERVIFGKYPDMSISNARVKAGEILALIAQGKNPNQEKRKLKAEDSFGQLYDKYIEQAKTYKRSWQGDSNLYQYYLADWSDRRISTIYRDDVARKHAAISKNNGKYAANRALALLRTIFNKATNEWGWEGKNPTAGIKKNTERSRDRFLHGDELIRFFQALNDEPNQIFRDYFLICLFTGARRTNVLTMRWRDINFERNVWTIPETKNGESLAIPLTDTALETINRRFKDKSSDWVFPSKLSKSGHLEEPKSAWKRILMRAEIGDLRVHDLRRTLGSWQAVTGASSYIIGKSLGHKDSKSTAVYARLHLDPVRASMEKATKAMIEATQNE